MSLTAITSILSIQMKLELTNGKEFHPLKNVVRVHTSSIQISVLKIDESLTFIKLSDCDTLCTRGDWPRWGQHRNTTDSCVTMIHRPTGIQVRIDGRNQQQNRKLWKILDNKVKNHFDEIKNKNVSSLRRNQLTKNKIRTYRVKDDLAVDHRTNKRTSLKRFIKGDIEILHE